MFITIEDMKTAIYKYQRNQISENDESIVEANMLAAMEEVRSYLAGRYDVDTIFAAIGTARNQLLVEYTKSIAVWYFLRLSNPDVIFEKAKAYYEYAVTWLSDVADGKLNPALPPKPDRGGIPDGSSVSWGSSEQRYDNSY